MRFTILNNIDFIQCAPLDKLLFISYLILAAFIALWMWPIWRDLLQLKIMAKQISQGNLNVLTQVNKRSPTAVVVNTFQQMAKRITRLLSEQTQLVNAVSHELRTPLYSIRQKQK
mgnify:CR=1 FL=1